MTQQPALEELAIVLTASNHAPKMVTGDFLKGHGVIPKSWEMAHLSKVSPNKSHVLFRNGVSLEVRSESVLIKKALAKKLDGAQQVIEISQRYVDALPHLNYRTVTISPRRFVPFATEAAARRCITCGWQEPNGDAPFADINLVYMMDKTQFRLSISSAYLQGRGYGIPAVLFNGHFDHRLGEERAAARLQSLNQALEQWQSDLEIYRDLVERRFLAGVQTA